MSTNAAIPDADPKPGRPVGKLAARLDSLMKGLRSEQSLVAPDLTEAVARHVADIHAAYRPEGGHQTWLLAQVADAAARLDHCQIMIRARHDDLMDRADVCWKEDRERAAEEIAARLFRDPARTFHRLRETAGGCRWILARWNALSVPLIEHNAWNEAQCNLAASLMGVGPDLRDSHPTLNPSASSDDHAAIMCEQADAVHHLMVEALDPLDAKERELTRLGYFLHPSRELVRLHRLETKLRRTLNESLDEFRRLRADAASRPEPITNVPPAPAAAPPPPLTMPTSFTMPAPEPESEPEPEPEPETETDDPLADKPVMSMLAAMLDAIATGRDQASEPEPEPSTTPTSRTPTPSIPLNRRARRAQESVNRKAKALAC